MTKGPWSLLPAPPPQTTKYPIDYFYLKLALDLIADTFRIMSNGLPIDLDKVRELEFVLDEILAKVESSLAANPIIQSYQTQKHARLIEEYRKERTSKLKDSSHFLKPFKPSDMAHRSYFMYVLAEDHPSIEPPSELLPTRLPKWTVKDLKPYLDIPAVKLLATKTLSESNRYALAAMELLAEHTAEIKNRPYLEDMESLAKVPFPKFSPASPDQKHDVLTDLLGYESNSFTDAYIDYEKAMRHAIRYNKPEPMPPRNKFSWSKDELLLLKEAVTDPHEVTLVNDLLEYSMGAIIKNNFIASFYAYTIDGRLHGDYVLLGAKSGRFTSKNPNMLNSPSTKSIYAKPIKKCFVAPPGYIVWGIDYSALEDRVIASLTKDDNKCNLFLDNLDGHSMGAIAYFPDEISKHMPLTGNMSVDARAMQELVDAKHPELKDLRQKGKPVTFGLSYGAFPPKVAKALNVSIEEATDIFNNYHQKLYPSITDYRENYVLRTVEEEGEIHLGLGFTMKSDNPGKDIRTLANATCQFWSILTAIGINELHHRIDETFVSSDTIQVTSTIYDSIYGICLDHPEALKWLNDNIVPILVKDFIEDQIVKNEAQLEIGVNWADLQTIPLNATLDDCESILKSLKESK